jgi:hypothetical protein
VPAGTAGHLASQRRLPFPRPPTHPPQLCDGASEAERAALRLKPAKQFRYLNQSACFDLRGVSNAEEYRRTRRSMGVVGIPEGEQDAVFRCVAAVLHLGNVTFADSAADGADASAVQPAAEEHLEAAAALLGVEGEGLRKALTTRTRHTPDGAIVSPIDVKAAADNRDSLAKTIYSRMFDWLVEKINTAIGQDAGAASLIGVLDIYGRGGWGGWGASWGGDGLMLLSALLFPAHDSANGGMPASAGLSEPPAPTPRRAAGFEQFQENDFEQFCINLANEKLQQHFNQHVFKMEQVGRAVGPQGGAPRRRRGPVARLAPTSWCGVCALQAEYEREAIEWSYIEFVDNQDVLDLIEARMGILDLLDESCRFPKVRRVLLLRQGGWVRKEAVVGSLTAAALGKQAAAASLGGQHVQWSAAHPAQATVQCVARPAASPPPAAPRAQATHEDFATKLYGAPSVADSRRFSKPKLSRTDFTIDHYAGKRRLLRGGQGGAAATLCGAPAGSRLARRHAAPSCPPGAVTYKTDNFLVKNRDFVVAEHQALLGASCHDFVRALFPPDADGGEPGGKGGGRGASLSAYRFSSVGSRFKRQLGELMEALHRMEPHYIRCIKPNSFNRPMDFENMNVLHQVRPPRQRRRGCQHACARAGAAWGSRICSARGVHLPCP